MELLWSLAVAISGNRWQMRPGENPQNHAKTVAVGCDPLKREVHGKGAPPPRKGGGHFPCSARSAKSCAPEGAGRT
jgi:hypothetical protein